METLVLKILRLFEYFLSFAAKLTQEYNFMTVLSPPKSTNVKLPEFTLVIGINLSMSIPLNRLSMPMNEEEKG